MPNINLSPLKTPMPTQAPEERICNFDEVALGYSEEQAKNEALRCLHCKTKPCVQGCPVKIDIPSFIRKIADEDYEGAYETIAVSSSLPAVCGRVCPQESQCEKYCTRGLKSGSEAVSIGRLERFVADYHLKNANGTSKSLPKTGLKVAVVGSGPAGLSCAGELARLGYEVTVFEALHAVGGVLTYGIPEFRLPKSIVKQEADNLRKSGVVFQTDVVVGRTVSLDELKTEYGFSAVFVGTGAGLPKFMNIEGESLNGVYSANEFLTRINLMKGYEKDSATPLFCGKEVAVVGGGNVAMDAARSARRLGAKVHIVYRRGEEELPARKEEAEHAKEEGIIFDLLVNPVRVLPCDVADKNDPKYGWVGGLECVRMELKEADASGRRSPAPIEGSNFVLPVDCVIMSLGTSPNPLLKNTTPELRALKRGEIETDENGKTSVEGVYCGGDAATGAATVIKAMGAGKNAARAIDEYLKNK